LAALTTGREDVVQLWNYSSLESLSIGVANVCDTRAQMADWSESQMTPPRVLQITFAFLSMAAHAQTPGRPHVYLTHRKAWLASGGFDHNFDSQSKHNAGQLGYTKEFQSGCASVILTDLEHADYAVAIDDKKQLPGLNDAKAARFQFEVYNRDYGQIFTGGEDLLRNAIKKTCNAIMSPIPIPLRNRE
jgi:hypothetical protein